MLGPIAPLSGDTKTCDLEKYKCSDCDLVISLPSRNKIQSIAEIIKDHTRNCMPWKYSSNAQPTASTFSPLANSYMSQQVLQPRRTWSAEDERRRRLEEDPDAYDVGPHSVTCAGCHRPIRLNATGRYYAANWNKHKMGCKNTNAVNGAGAVSADSKFTGRVAAFRVAKPSETSEVLSHDIHPNISSSEAQQSPNPLSEVSAHSYAQLRTTPSSSKRRLDLTHSDDIFISGGARDTERTSRAYYEASIADSDSSKDDTNYQLSAYGPKIQNGLPYIERRITYGYENQFFRKPRTTEDSPEFPSRKSPYPTTDQYEYYPQNTLEFSRYKDLQRSPRDRSQYSHIRGRNENRLSNLNLDPALRSLGPQALSLRRHINTPLHPSGQRQMKSNYQNTEDEEGSYTSELETCSTVSSPEFEVSRPPQPKSSSPHRDSRALPSLRSLSLSGRTSTDLLPRAHSGEILYSRPLSNERHSRDHLKLPPLVPALNRERIRDVNPVNKRAQSSTIETDPPESVVLPPIRTPQSPLHAISSGLKRRMDHDIQERGEQEGGRPSPPKVFVLPNSSSKLSSTLQPDDSTLKYKLTSAPRAASEKPENLLEDVTTRGPSRLQNSPVGSSSPCYNSLSDLSPSTESCKEGGVRLHPVWKWDQIEDAEVPIEILPEEGDTDIEMDMQDTR